ncbi:hypothetical protein HJFPF1_07072 [Paramyrothecium foliicola]|nr:hypothetical protein HJFPF1_07072 [Paramyrothecium foliicola]
MDDYENRGPELQAVCYTLVITAFVACVLRCYTRALIVKSFGFDDWCMLAALAFFILFVTCALVGVEHGTGRHWWVLEDEDRKTAMRYWWYCYLWYCLSMIASKISIGYFLLRITIRRWDIWAIYGVMAVTVLTGIVFFFVTLFQCNPISFFWNKDQNGSCVNIDVIIALTYLYSACSVICDFTFALLPLVLIYRLNMDKRSKIALVPIVIMACVASAAVVVRFAYVKDFKNPDFLWATIDIAIWSNTEQGLAITAGSLATLRPLVRSIGLKIGTRVSDGPSAPAASDRRSPAIFSDRSRDGKKGSGKERSMIRLTELTTDKDDGFKDTSSRTETRNDDWSHGRQGSEEELTSGTKHGHWDDGMSKAQTVSVADERV